MLSISEPVSPPVPPPSTSSNLPKPPVSHAEHLVAQFKSKEGELVGSSLSIPVSINVKELEILLNHLLGNDPPLPYSFFVNQTEILNSIQSDFLQTNEISIESLLTIVYQPQAVFKVRPVTRCGATMPGHTDAVLSVHFSPDGKSLASGSGDTTVRLWDLTTFTPKATLKKHTHWVLAVAWSPNAQSFVSGSMDGRICLWDAATLTSRDFRGHTDAVTCLAWEPYHLNPTCSRFCSGSRDGTLRVWDTSTGVSQFVLTQHTKAITCVKWGGEGVMYSASRDCSIKVWSGDDGRLLRTLSGHGHWVNTMTLSTEALLRAGPFEFPPKKPTLTPSQVLQRYQQQHKGSERLVSGSDDFTLYLWNKDESKPLHRMTGHQALVNCVTFSMQGDKIASASFDKCIKVWDGLSGQFLYNLRGHVSAIYQLSFSPDDRLLVSCSKDATCKIWDLRTKKLKVDLPGHSDEIFAVDWAPSGEFVCSGGKDRVLKIWRY